MATRPTSPSSVAEKSSVWRFERCHLHDPVHDWAKAHVEHPVRLVEDEQADPPQRHLAALDEIEQASGRGDEDVRSCRQTRLLDDSGAAVDGRYREGARVRDRAQVFDDLRRELARGRKHERRRARIRVLQLLDERHTERERLARAGRRLCEHVMAREHVGDDHALNGEWCS